MQQRSTSFSSGSRQAPDPYDQFLEQEGFYRKHTARDASSLFRVISEQMYDTQKHHLAIRKKCVSYMQKHRKFFQILIDRDLDEYLDEMSKPKTFASLIELQAVGLLYERNVLLFEPFNLGNIFGHFRPCFQEVFRVFCTPEKHFDSVYTSLFIKDAAICQSLVYEVLYKDLFKLPDVQYAVEIMLHNGNLEPQQYQAEANDDGYQTRIELVDKRSFPLDLPQHTKCILEDSRLCCFHNSVADENTVEKSEQKLLVKQNAELLLTNKYISCVRQLLLEGITPFPYKVAKALDPTMYRNIEFDSWNEARKELKFQNWYCGDGNFKVGAKCHVKLGRNEELYTGHIQDISTDRTHCLVFIEQLGEKRLVSYDALSPLSVEDFKPWALPYRVHRQLQRYHSMRLSRHYNCNFKTQQATMQNYCKTFRAGMTKGGQQYAGATFSMDYSDIKQHHQYIAAGSGQQRFHKSCIYNLTHLENFHARTLEYVTMPLTVEHSVNMKYSTKNNCNNASESDVVGHGEDSSTTANSPAAITAAGDSAVDTTATVAADGDSGAADDSPGSREVALINHNYVLEQTAPEYVPEYTTFYPMPSCVGTPEDFYGYGCEPAMHQQFGHNGMYYMCNPANGGPNAIHAYSPIMNNYYGPAMQTPQSVIISPTPMPAQPQQYICTSANPYYANPIPTTAVMPTLLTQATSLSHTIQENSNSSAIGIATPLSGRINYEAKKSFKSNGTDLPSDIPTLRYFYNLGIDSHNRRRYSHESSISGREAITVKEERAIETKDNNNNASKSDDNNNLSTAANAKSNSSNTNSSHNGNNKSQYGQQRRFQMRYNNNSRDYRQPQRRNSCNDDNVNTGSFTNSQNSYGHRNNYNEYTKNNKHQNQHGNSGDRHTDSNRPSSTPNISHNGGGGNHRMQYSRNYNRNPFYENVGHGGTSTAGVNNGEGVYEGARDVNNGNEHAENGPMYPPYGPPLPPSQQHSDHPNDYNVSNINLPPSNAIGSAVNGANTAPSNLIIPLHVHQPPGGPYNTTVYTTTPPAPASLLQPATQGSAFGNGSNYTAPAPPASTSYFGHPPPTPLMHQGAFNGATMNYGGSLVGPAGFYPPTNPLSSNASESSGNGNGGGNGDNNQSQPPPVGPYSSSIPIYVSPNGANVNTTNGQPMLHHASLPPPHINGGPQAFWCVPPPPPAVGQTLMQTPAAPHIPPPLTSINFVGPISTPNNNGVLPNRKTQQQNQNQTDKETTQQ